MKFRIQHKRLLPINLMNFNKREVSAMEAPETLESIIILVCYDLILHTEKIQEASSKICLETPDVCCLYEGTTHNCITCWLERLMM